MPQTDQNYIEVNTALVFGVVFYFATVGQSVTGSARAWGRDGESGGGWEGEDTTAAALLMSHCVAGYVAVPEKVTCSNCVHFR